MPHGRAAGAPTHQFSANTDTGPKLHYLTHIVCQPLLTNHACSSLHKLPNMKRRCSSRLTQHDGDTLISSNQQPVGSDHTTLKTPVLVRTPKLSNVGPS